jgi:hypothetical protein
VEKTEDTANKRQLKEETNVAGKKGEGRIFSQPTHVE